MSSCAPQGGRAHVRRACLAGVLQVSGLRGILAGSVFAAAVAALPASAIDIAFRATIGLLALYLVLLATGFGAWALTQLRA